MAGKVGAPYGNKNAAGRRKGMAAAAAGAAAIGGGAYAYSKNKEAVDAKVSEYVARARDTAKAKAAARTQQRLRERGNRGSTAFVTNLMMQSL